MGAAIMLHQPQQALAGRGGNIARMHPAIRSQHVKRGQSGEPRVSRFPIPSLAIGWFQVAYSDEVVPGAEPLRLRYFGRDLIAWRDRSGTLAVTDAYCPHLGAHLGWGGRVDEQGLRCPLHGWWFGADGGCTLPDGTPHPVALRRYPVVERNSLVLAWFDPDDRPPAWTIPAEEQITAGRLVPIGRRRWSADTIWQEVAESMLDLTHVSHLHGLPPYQRHEATADGPRRHVRMAQPLRTALGAVTVDMELDAYGPGYTVARFGDGMQMLFQTFSPVDEDTVDVRFTFFGRDMGSPRRTARLGAALMDDLVRQTEEHLPIWSHKRYLPDPSLTADDGPIAEFRAWARQFHVR